MLGLKACCVLAFISLLSCKAVEPEEEWSPAYFDSNDTSAVLDESHTRINGGRPVAQIIPYQVSLQRQRRGRYEHFCGGCIITDHHVLTAAHCLLDKNVNNILVVVGTTSWLQGGDRHRVLDMRMHHRFSMNPTIMNDIGILKVWPAFNLGKPSVGVLALGGRARIGENVPVRLTGWGSMMPSQIVVPEQLQMLDYHTISNGDCAQRGHRITANELCAQAERGRGACMGDSGGPLVTLYGTPQLVGLVSYGSPICAQGQPDVYTRVSSFLPYINRVITSEMP